MENRYHVKGCNTRRGEQYPCDCSYPVIPEAKIKSTIHDRVEALRFDRQRINARVLVPINDERFRHMRHYIDIDVMQLVDELYEQFLLQQDDGK